MILIYDLFHYRIFNIIPILMTTFDNGIDSPLFRVALSPSPFCTLWSTNVLVWNIAIFKSQNNCFYRPFSIAMLNYQRVPSAYDSHREVDTPRT